MRQILPCFGLVLALLAPPGPASQFFGRSSQARQQTSSAAGSNRRPPAEGVDVTRLGRIDALVAGAIGAGKLPGAVVYVGHRGDIVYHKAFGDRAVVPAREAMTEDTIFVIATVRTRRAGAAPISAQTMVLLRRSTATMIQP